MSNKKWKKKLDIATIVGNLLVIILVIIAAIIVITVPILVLYGASDILANFNMIKINFFENVFYNFMYFGFLLLVVLFVAIIFELILIVIFKVLRLKITKKTMFISYIIQIFLSVISYKIFIENIFTRIDISWAGTIILFILIYLSSFVISDDHKIINDRNR